MAYLSYSTYFNGSTTLTTPSSTSFVFGSGDFTAEMWIYPNGAQSADACLISTRSSSFSTGSGAWEIRFGGTNFIRTQVRPISSGDYSINAAGTTTITVTNTVGGTLTFVYPQVAIATNNQCPLEVTFNPAIPATAANTNMVAAITTGGGTTSTAVVLTGYII
jgi:hypothetical protein